MAENRSVVYLLWHGEELVGVFSTYGKIEEAFLTARKKAPNAKLSITVAILDLPPIIS